MLRRRRTQFRNCRGRRGTVAVVAVICLVPLIGVLAFVLDGGLQMAIRRQVQAAADATAHAAACSLYTNSSTGHGLDPNGTAKRAALAIAADNGYNNDGTHSVVTINIPPTSGIFAGVSGYAEVTVKRNQPRTFSAIWGSGTLPITARAVARGTFAPYSTAGILLLDPSSAGALTVSGGGRAVSNAAIQVNSSNVGAVNANNTGYVKAPLISIVGNYKTSSSGYLSGTVATAASAVSNPLSSLAAPSTAGLTTRGSIPTYGTYTMNPGIYNGGVSIGGGMTVTMNPGIYYMKSGSFQINNGATVTGNGVTIYVDNGGGQFSFQGGGNITLSAPTSGAYAGIVMFQDANSTKPISIANGSTTTITGTIYAPGAAVSLAGGSSNSQYGSQVIAKTMNISNNANFSTNFSNSTVASRRALGIVQ
ncbi:DUF7305 domain-containing protein [Singulisphaera sp. PoT]|uniref:DUF7305 domain-containing protein n=1 Tax=Singulisphaera sp. PoT TaxID=3411797 RepID=UPI003BF5083A